MRWTGSATMLPTMVIDVSNMWCVLPSAATPCASSTRPIHRMAMTPDAVHGPNESELWMKCALWISAALRLPSGQLSQHGVVRRQIGVVVAVGGTVESGRDPLIAAPPLDQHRHQHQYERDFSCGPSNSASESLVANQVVVPGQLQRLVERAR